MRRPDRRPASDLLGLAGHRDPAASGSVNRTFRLLVQSDPASRTGFMIADAVRYMSVHSWTQRDSHGLSGTSSGPKQQPARPGKSSSRAISAGSGRCWVRTNVGLADGFTDRSAPGQGARRWPGPPVHEVTPGADAVRHARQWVLLTVVAEAGAGALNGEQQQACREDRAGADPGAAVGG